MIDLTTMQYDALLDIFNIGIGQAEKDLSAIAAEAVNVDISSIRFLNRNDVLNLLGNDRIYGVSQSYQGAFEAQAILMFAERKGFEIVRLMMGEMVPADRLTKLEQEALCEIGNIVLNGCAISLANVLGQTSQGLLPVYFNGDCAALIGAAPQTLLSLHINILLEKSQVDGYLVFLIGEDFLQQLQRKLDFYFSKARFNHE